MAAAGVACERCLVRGAGRAGFTLLELLVVVGVMAMLMGVGVGLLQRGSTDLNLALSIVRDQMRLAANTAKSRGLPTEVLVLPGDPGEPIRLQARVLANVGYWHFEPDETWFNVMLRPQLTGTDEPRGRFGAGRRPDPELRSPLLAVVAGHDAFALEDGFALRLELFLEEREAMDVARLGRAFELTLDQDLLPRARLTVADPGPRPGPVSTVQGQRPLPLHAWVTVELVHDGRELLLLIDGRLEGSAAARGMPFQQPSDVFEISLGAAPVRGVVDEIRLLAYERAAPVDLPLDVELRDLQGPVRFSRRGELLTPTRFTVVSGEESATRQVAPGGVLRPPADGGAP